MRRPNLKLEASDKTTVLRNGKLIDHHITIAQNILHQQFPHISGLQPTTLGPAQQYEIMREDCMQILHTGEDHWV